MAIALIMKKIIAPTIIEIKETLKLRFLPKINSPKMMEARPITMAPLPLSTIAVPPF